MPEHPARFAAKLDRKWDRTILKCLDPNPEKRPRVEQICAVLDPPAPLPRRKLVLRALASLAVLAVLLPMFAYFKLANLPGSRPISPVRLAILPAHISPDVHSADGLLYDLSDRLRRIPDKRLVTIPVADVLQKKIRDPDSAKSRLGATHVLEYWLNRSDSKIVFRATITDARTLLKVHELEGEHEAANLKGVATALFGTVTATFELTPGVPGEQVNSSAYPYYAQATFFNRRDNRSGDLAIPLFEKAIEFDPASCLPYAGLLEAYLTKYHRSGDRQWIDRAKQALRDASSRNPDSAVVHIQAGNLYRAVGSYESALRHYLRAIQLEPSNSDAWLFVAHVYELLPEHQTDAAQAYQRAVDLQPGYYAPEVNLSNFYIHAGRYTEAEKRLRKVVELAPELPQGHSSLCAVYDVMGRFRDAEKSCHRALQLDESTAALDNFAVMFEHLGRNQDALTYYRRAIDLAPKRYQYYQGAGDCYRRLNQARQAKTAYLTGRELAADALADNPSDGVTHAVLGYYFARLADGRNAEREVAQAIRLSSDDLEVIRTSALAEEALHHRDKVLALIRGTSIEFLQSLGREPDLADFRLDSRYQAMVAQHAAN